MLKQHLWSKAGIPQVSQKEVAWEQKTTCFFTNSLQIYHCDKSHVTSKNIPLKAHFADCGGNG